MYPVEFEQQNKVLTKPATMSDEECKSLPCFNDGTVTISRWQMTWRERLECLLTGKVWVRVIGGNSSPPIWTGTEFPFVRAEDVEE